MVHLRIASIFVRRHGGGFVMTTRFVMFATGRSVWELYNLNDTPR
jgi:hypothetical protein